MEMLSTTQLADDAPLDPLPMFHLPVCSAYCRRSIGLLLSSLLLLLPECKIACCYGVPNSSLPPLQLLLPYHTGDIEKVFFFFFDGDHHGAESK
jgi:hypothetical protein